MREDITPLYISPLCPAYSASPQPPSLGDDATAKDDNHAIDSLIRQRPRILQVKLAVLATQIGERLQIRANNLGKIDEELLSASNALLPFDDWSATCRLLDEGTRRFWLEQQSKLSGERRAQEVECWRDVAQAMNDFLTVWEAVEQSKVRGEFLRDQKQEEAL